MPFRREGFKALPYPCRRMSNVIRDDSEPSGLKLPRDRECVVPLTAQAKVVPEHCVGRVEHVTSGQATHFHTGAECLAFMARVLRARRPEAPQLNASDRPAWERRDKTGHPRQQDEDRPPG